MLRFEAHATSSAAIIAIACLKKGSLLTMLSSGLCGLPHFKAPFSQDTFRYARTLAILSNLFEDLPQLVIQAVGMLVLCSVILSF